MVRGKWELWAGECHIGRDREKPDGMRVYSISDSRASAGSIVCITSTSGDKRYFRLSPQKAVSLRHFSFGS